MPAMNKETKYRLAQQPAIRDFCKTGKVQHELKGNQER